MNETTAQAPVGILWSITRWFRQHFNYRPLLLLFVAGLSLRIILMLMYFPAVMLSFDSPRYARIDSMPMPGGVSSSTAAMFGDFWMPAGYPMLLKILRGISDQLWFTIAAQHVLGLTVGLILFLVMRHAGTRPWIACLPAAVAFFSGDHLYCEHIIMAESFLIFLTAA